MPICLVCEKTVRPFQLKDGVCESCLGNESSSNVSGWTASADGVVRSELPPSSVILYILSISFLIATTVIAFQFWPSEALRAEKAPFALYIPFILSLLCGTFMTGVLFSLASGLNYLNKMANKSAE